MNKIQEALKHINNLYPEVHQVFYGTDSRWLYCGEAFCAPKFGDEVDIGLLEAAADEACVPSAHMLLLEEETITECDGCDADCNIDKSAMVVREDGELEIFCDNCAAADKEETMTGCPNCDETGRSTCPLCGGTNIPFPEEKLHHETDKHTRIIIEGIGGVVRAVYSNDPEINCDCLDWDDLNEKGIDPEIIDRLKKLSEELTAGRKSGRLRAIW